MRTNINRKKCFAQYYSPSLVADLAVKFARGPISNILDAAHYAAIWEPTIKRYYQKKCKSSPTMVAKKAIANKLTRACYHMLKENTPFDIKRAFG